MKHARTVRDLFLFGQLLILILAGAVGCDSAGYRPPPDLPDRQISVSQTVITDPVVRQVVQEEIDHGAQYTEDIRRLDLSRSRTGDDPRLETIAGIQQFRNLTYLDLRGQRLTGAEMAFIVGLVSLEELYLDGNRIDSSALERIARLERLRVLSVRGNLVEEFSALSTLPNLQVLDLSFNSRLYDDPRPLESMESLQRLVLQGAPQMDERALGELTHARPDMDIVWP